MRISIVRGGGLAGVVTKTAVESKALPPDREGELRDRVERAGVFDLPETLGAGPGPPDNLAYAVTVEDDDRTHTVHVSEDAVPDAVRELVSWVDSVPEREERVEPPGGG